MVLVGGIEGCPGLCFKVLLSRDDLAQEVEVPDLVLYYDGGVDVVEQLVAEVFGLCGFGLGERWVRHTVDENEVLVEKLNHGVGLGRVVGLYSHS